jgi:type IX secretion system substrate protein
MILCGLFFILNVEQLSINFEYMMTKTILLVLALLFLSSTGMLAQLKLITPNGGERIKSGSEIEIKWEGIPAKDTVLIDYTTDGGTTWRMIANDATGLNYNWKSSKDIIDDDFKIRLRQFQGIPDHEPFIEWQRVLGEVDYYNRSQMIISKENDILVKLKNEEENSINNEEFIGSRLIKFNLMGSVLWHRAMNIEEKYDYHIVNYDKSNRLIYWENAYDYDNFVKLNSAGQISWTKSYWRFPEVVLISETSDGCFIVFANDALLIKLDNDGNKIWEKQFIGTSSKWLNCFQETDNGDYMLLAGGISADGDFEGAYAHQADDIWLFKMDKNGKLLLKNNYCGIDNDLAFMLYKESENSYYIAGSSRSEVENCDPNQGWADLLLMNIDSLGNVLFQRTYGTIYEDRAKSIDITNDGKLMIFGDTDKNYGNKDEGCYINVMKTERNGDIIWEKRIEGGDCEILKVGYLTNDGGSIFLGTTTSNDGDVEYHEGEVVAWLVKLSREGIVVDQDESDMSFVISGVEDSESSSGLALYPNPADNLLNVSFVSERREDAEISIVNSLGEEIIPSKIVRLVVGENSTSLNIDELKNGSYYLSIKTASGRQTKAFIKVK